MSNYILCSATLSNARVLAEKMIGSPRRNFTEDTSGKEKEVFSLSIRQSLMIYCTFVQDQSILQPGFLPTF
jgi:ATP-dependent helicase YprA (DUF1998 family)